MKGRRKVIEGRKEDEEGRKEEKNERLSGLRGGKDILHDN